MGKVHRIKKQFRRLLSQEPWKDVPPGHITYHRVRGITVYVGKRYDGSHYVGSYGDAYKGLMRQLQKAVG